MKSGNPIALSWAEVLLVLLIVIGGTGVWTLCVRLVTDSYERAAEESPPDNSAGEDDVLLHARNEVERLRTALLQERIEAARQEVLRTYLRDQYAGLREKPPAGAAPVPDDARAEYDATARAIAVSGQVTRVIAADLVRTEAASVARSKQLTQAREQKSRGDRVAKQARDRSLWLSSRGVATAGVLALLALSWVTCHFLKRSAVIDCGRIVRFAALALLLIVVNELFGAAGLMVGALGLIVLILRTAGVKR